MNTVQSLRNDFVHEANKVALAHGSKTELTNVYQATKKQHAVEAARNFEKEVIEGVVIFTFYVSLPGWNGNVYCYQDNERHHFVDVFVNMQTLEVEKVSVGNGTGSRKHNQEIKALAIQAYNNLQKIEPEVSCEEKAEAPVIDAEGYEIVSLDEMSSMFGAACAREVNAKFDKALQAYEAEQAQEVESIPAPQADVNPAFASVTFNMILFKVNNIIRLKNAITDAENSNQLGLANHERINLLITEAELSILETQLTDDINNANNTHNRPVKIEPDNYRYPLNLQLFASSATAYNTTHKIERECIKMKMTVDQLMKGIISNIKEAQLTGAKMIREGIVSQEELQALIKPYAHVVKWYNGRRAENRRKSEYQSMYTMSKNLLIDIANYKVNPSEPVEKEEQYEIVSMEELIADTTESRIKYESEQLTKAIEENNNNSDVQVEPEQSYTILPNGIIINRFSVIGHTSTIYEAFEPSSYNGNHRIIQLFNNRVYGNIASRRTGDRINNVNDAFDAILTAYPEIENEHNEVDTQLGRIEVFA